MSRRALVFLVTIAGALLATAVVLAGVLITDDEDEPTAREAGTITSSTTLDGEKGWLGLNVASNISGPRITSIEPSGPSAQAGLQVNDIIRSVNGQIVRLPEELKAAIESRKPGERVSLTYERANRELRADVTLAATPANAQIEEASPALPPALTQVNPNTPQAGAAPSVVYPVLTNQMRSGLLLQPVTPELIDRYNLGREQGMVVVNVVPQSHGSRAGFQEGDLVLAIGGTSVSNSSSAPSDEALARIFDALPVGRAVNFRILRGNRETALPLALPMRQDLPPLEGAPPPLRLMLESMLDAGVVTYDQASTLLSSGQSQAVKVGHVKDIDALRLTLSLSPRTDDLTIAVTPDTRFQRGPVPVSGSELRNGEVVMIMSIDGGKTAIAVFSYGT